MTYTKEREDFFAPPSQDVKLTQGSVKKNDKLVEMFGMQAELDGRIIAERGIGRDLSEWVVGLTIAMESEIDEIRREVNWKWWKNEKPVDKDLLQGEVIDMWHFLLSLSRVVGLTPADIHRLYVEKNAENHDRQNGTSEKEGYDVEG
ncbi:dUTPase [Sporosarcina phage Lietuvens]|nr:dUTPase [Sporosarcina phage Lietuvens]